MTASSAIPPVGSYAPDLVTRAPEGTLTGGARLLLVAGIVALAASCIGLFTHQAEQFYHSYLVAYMFTLSFPLGALFFVIVQHVARAGWSIVVRRLAENMAATLPAMLILFIPIVLGRETLYGHWMHADLNPGSPGFDALVAAKSGYLNQTFFLVRAAIYFVIWIGLALFFRHKSLQQDDNGNPALSLRMARLGAPALILFGLSITFAAFDWMMSLNPHWFSTMYGVTYFAAAEMGFLAVLALICMWLNRKGLMRDIVNTEHYHDIGKLMFAFMVFWAYVTFSQYMLIHYADIPEETVWFQDRKGSWETIGVILIIGHFLFPFAFLLSRHMKRNRKPLAVGAICLVLLHWIDMIYQIMPTHSDHFSIHWLDITTIVALPCIFLGLSLLRISSTHLIPIRDPKLRESLKFTNF